MAKDLGGDDDGHDSLGKIDETFLGAQMRLCARIVEEGPEALGPAELLAVDQLVSQLKIERRYRSYSNALVFKRPRRLS